MVMHSIDAVDALWDDSFVREVASLAAPKSATNYVGNADQTRTPRGQTYNFFRLV